MLGWCGVLLAMVAGCGRLAFDPTSQGVGGDSGSAATVIGCDGHALPQAWRFDADAEGWTFFDDVGTVSLPSWTTSTFRSPPGAFRVDIAGSAGRLGWFLSPGPWGDLRTRTFAAWVMTTSSNVSVKGYGQSFDTTWADGGVVDLVPGVWTCVTMSFDASPYATGDFDPTIVDEVGIEIDGDASAVVVIDDPGY